MTQPDLLDPHPLIDAEVVTDQPWPFPEVKPWAPAVDVAQDEPEEEATEAELVCFEAYQVVGSLLCDLGIFDTPEAEKILDNLSQARMVHSDVLPWESYERRGWWSRLTDRLFGWSAP